MSSRRRRGTTLAEHDALLKAEGRYDAMIERQRRRQEEIDRRAAEWRRAEAPLVAELNAAGYAVESAWDLVNTADPYPEAVPILLKHMEHPYPDRVRQGVARALAVPEARFGWDALKRLYQRESAGTEAKDGLAVALAAVAEDEVIGDLIALARDTRNGTSRLLLLSALERSHDPQARKTLMELGSDPELYKELQIILRRLKRRRARSKAIGKWQVVSSANTRRGENVSATRSAVTDATRGLSETSTNLDVELLGPFLERVSGLVGGFGSAEVEEALEVFEYLGMKEERERTFQVQHGGRTVPLVVRLFKSDEDAPDIALFGPSELVAEIEELIPVFWEETGSD